MKKINAVLLLAMVAVSVMLAGCAKDSDTTTDTGNRSAFLGDWNVQENWTKLTYDVTITEDPNSNDGVFIYRFAGTLNTSPPAAAVVSGNSIVLDADQVIGENWKINGSGTLSNGKINWNYTILDDATLIHAVATYTRP